ncbi:MAG TPA: DUF6765 family protein [Rectinemataceae bacterium]|nr:DUF6765 family protein [Rectinemataceae bacterium]
MNLEFHYYAIAALAIRAGMPPDVAHRIARSSQQVDQAIFTWEILDLPMTVGGRANYTGAGYRTEKTQDYVFWDEDVFRNIYLPFHFIPGDRKKASRERVDGLDDPWITTPDSPLARELLVRALRSGDHFRIGIALHAYADTWAHQNFSGRLGAANDLSPRSPLPPAGHLQALGSPDQTGERWRDPRLHRPEVDNRERFLDAARMIYRFLRTSLRRDFDDETLVIPELGELWKRSDLDDRARSFDFSIRYDIEPWNASIWLADAGIVDDEESEEKPRHYDKLRWLGAEIAKRAVRRDGLRRVDTGGRFEGSELHKWSEAAKAHRAEALTLIDESLGASLEGRTIPR